jgi:hypothetical protein
VVSADHTRDGALALLTVLRAGMIAVEAFKKCRARPPAQSSLAAFKTSRGRGSLYASRRFVGSCGVWLWPCSRPSTTSWRGRTGAAGISAWLDTSTTSVVAHWLGPWLHNYHCNSRARFQVIFLPHVAADISPWQPLLLT